MPRKTSTAKTAPPPRRRSATKPARAAKPQPAFAKLPLAALRVFGAVAAQRSFSTAAETLNLTTSAVSMQIRTLEDYLQVRLFHRSSHHVDLTAEGERLLPFVTRGLEELEQGFRMVRAGRSAGVLVVTLLTSYLQRWLLPRLPSFHQAHPRIDLRLQSGSRLVDFSRSDVHVAIRMGSGNWPRLHIEKLSDEWLVPVCAPALLKRHGPIAGPGGVNDYPLLHSSSEPWQMWTEGLKVLNGWDYWPQNGSAYDDSVAVLSAAEGGQGLALARWSLVSDMLDSGRLVAASDAVIPYFYQYYFVCPKAYLEMDKVAQFRSWLIAETAKRVRPPSSQSSLPGDKR